jgi:hypothetical protein
MHRRARVTFSAESHQPDNRPHGINPQEIDAGPLKTSDKGLLIISAQRDSLAILMVVL